MHLKDIEMWVRVEHILPWGPHFNTLEVGCGRMERKNFVGLLETVRGRTV